MRYLKNKKGVILVLVTVLLPILIGVVDYVMYQHRIQFVRHKMFVIADAASLAGANQVNEDYYREQLEVRLLTNSEPPGYEANGEKTAKQMAKDFIEMNDFTTSKLQWVDDPSFDVDDNDEVKITIDNNTGKYSASIKVEITKKMSPYFIHNWIDGFKKQPFHVEAKAIVGTKE